MQFYGLNFQLLFAVRGTGLGLSISKRLVEAMGGTIQVNSVLEQGSTFKFAVCLQQSDTPVASEVANQLVGLRVLIVVSHANNRRMLERQLTPEGCDLTFAAPADEGLAQYREMLTADRPPAAVIVDYELSDHGGPWFATTIRASGAPPSSMILLASLSTSLSDSDLPLFDRIVTKPAKTIVLVRALAELTQPGGPSIAAGDGAPAALALSDMRILLAEDNPVNQKLAVRLLQRLGAEVQVAVNGLEQALRTSDFDAVLMDCQMPELDGYEATRQIRSGDAPVRNPNIPVIALTAHALATDRTRCLAAGMNDYLTKPINPIALQQALSRLLPAAAARPDHPAAELRGLFDEAALLARTDNDRAFARELIELFVRSASATLAQLDDALRDRAEPETTRKLAHSLKGSAATAAAAALAAGAADLERVAGSRREAAALSSLHATFALTMAEWARLDWIARGGPEAQLRAASGDRV